MARLFAMALVLAVARRGSRGADLCAGAVFGIGWVFFGATRGVVGLCGILAAALAAATIYCTGMIYASLKPIHQWHNRWVVPGYLALGLMSGLLLLDFLVRFWAPLAALASRC